METRLAKLSNKIFTYFIFFLIAFIWSNIYLKNIIVCFIFSIFIATVLSLIVFKIFNIKTTKSQQKTNLANKLNLTITNLIFSSKSEQINYFFNVIKFSNETAIKTEDYIKLNNSIIIPLFNYELTTAEFIETYLKYKNTKQLIILTNKLCSNLETLLNKLNLENLKILCATDTFYKIINPTEIYPPNKVQLKTKPIIKFKELLYVAFNKQNAKRYFASGIILMLFSFVYTFSLYYQIVATILFLFSLFSHFNTRFNPPKNTDLFNNKKND
jgi:hypothetical protein